MKKYLTVIVLFNILYSVSSQSHVEKKDSIKKEFKNGVCNFILFSHEYQQSQSYFDEEFVFLSPCFVREYKHWTYFAGLKLGQKHHFDPNYGAPIHQALVNRIGVNIGLNYFLINKQKSVVPFVYYNGMFKYKRGAGEVDLGIMDITAYSDNYFFENVIGFGLRFNLSKCFYLSTGYSAGVLNLVRVYNNTKTKYSMPDYIASICIGYNFK